MNLNFHFHDLVCHRLFHLTKATKLRELLEELILPLPPSPLLLMGLPMEKLALGIKKMHACKVCCFSLFKVCLPVAKGFSNFESMFVIKF